MKVWWGWLIAIIAAPFVLFFIARGTILLATHIAETHYPPPGKMVSVGSHRLHLYCVGTGSPKVVLEMGLGQDWVAWTEISLRLAETNEVCMYDRGGYGWSDAGPTPRTAVELATELHSLLSNASVPAPYLLVAHSFGGYIARIYASRYGEMLRGIVMVDALQEEDGHKPGKKAGRGIRTWIPPIGWERLNRLLHGRNALPMDLRVAPKAYQDRFLFASSLRQLNYEEYEFEALPLSEAELREEPFPRDVPLTVITAGRNPAHWEQQTRLASLSRCGKHLRADNSGHAIQVFQPELIVEAVEEMMRNDRSSIFGCAPPPLE
jgi:pimeloyl-ACP methyl ester carboxylesterase